LGCRSGEKKLTTSSRSRCRSKKTVGQIPEKVNTQEAELPGKNKKEGGGHNSGLGQEKRAAKGKNYSVGKTARNKQELVTITRGRLNQ